MSTSLLGALCCRRGIQIGNSFLGQQLRIGSSSKWLTTSSGLRTDAVTKPEEDFWEKNKRLNRPTSPHLSIYKFQITSVLSVTHRATGLALSGLTSGFAIGMLLLPQSFPYYLNLLSTTPVGAGLLFTTKFILAFPFMFHFMNGIRHLAWDLGKGFAIKSVYTTGYAVLGSSLLFSIMIAAM